MLGTLALRLVADRRDAAGAVPPLSVPPVPTVSYPALNESPALESVVSWRNPQGIFGKVALLTPDRIVFGNPDDETEIAAAIEAFQRDGTLPQRAEVIRLESIYQIRYDEKSTSMSVVYVEESSEGRRYEYDFGDHTARNSFVSLLVEHFGDRFEARVKRLSAWTASFKPLLVSAVIALLTWMLHRVAVDLAAGGAVTVSGRHEGTKRALAWMIELIGPIGVLAVGAALLTTQCVALVRRVLQPPMYRYYSRRS